MYQNYVTFLMRVTRFAPLQFFGQSRIKADLSQFLKFFPPLFGFPQKSINIGIHNFFSSVAVMLVCKS
ncbi:MAG: hypothetical protein Udaeo_00890 [Candidatus Udaeobacter sp.]|nr:MAG: hypothetical protein Udaeo_00890 [Candidatus Udaeobacter sp.]